MAEYVIMPKQGQSVESCTITEWMKKVGDDIKEGDHLFSFETDKATFEQESMVNGKLLAILAEEGDEVPCLQNVAIIGQEHEDISSMIFSTNGRNELKEKKEQNEKHTITENLDNKRATIDKKLQNGRLSISPRAKAAAERQGVDASLAKPTGPNGRIVEHDIYVLSEEKTFDQDAKYQDTKSLNENFNVQGDYSDKKLSNIRKVIAKTMYLSSSSMAQLTNHTSFDASKLIMYREQIKARREDIGTENITLNDMILFAVSRIILNHPELNAYFLDEKMRIFHTVNLGMAVDTDRGLLVPTLFSAEKKSLREISKESKDLISAAQLGNISPDLLTSGTFTVSNIGFWGVESFTPLINPPQTAILGVGSIISRVREIEGKISAYPAIGLSLTYDHRAIDGAPAARFTKDLCKALENFDLLLLTV